MISENEAFAMIRAAVEEVKAGAGAMITLDTHLVDDAILDSLDVMAFLYELETMRGARLEAIEEDFTDFRVARLVELLRAAG